jgi:hypothetical protein
VHHRRQSVRARAVSRTRRALCSKRLSESAATARRARCSRTRTASSLKAG